MTAASIETVAAPAIEPGTDSQRHSVAGARAMGPWLLGVVPFGFVVGISAAQAHIPVMAGWLTGPLIFAGSAQIATIEMLDAGSAPIVAVLAALTINLRLVLYSAAMAHHWQGAPRRWQAVAAYLLVDPSFAVGVDGYERLRGRAAHLHYFGGAVTLWLAWVVSITVGVCFGSGVPAGLRLDLVIPLFLIGEVVPRLGGRATNRAVAAAVVAAVVGLAIPLHLGPVLAMAAGIGIALATKEEEG